MIQAPAQFTTILETIVARIVSELRPRRVYLFGSRARGDARPDSDYDVMVELDKPTTSRRRDGRRMADLFDVAGVEVQLHLRNPGELEHRKDDPGTVDWDVVREGKLLFALPGIAPLHPAPKGARVREPRVEPPESLRDWLIRAEEDLRLANHLSADFAEWTNPICFHCQQSAEKFLKALIIAQNERPGRTHKLYKLLEHLRAVGMALPGLDADCRLLSPFAAETRYPDDEEETGVRPPDNLRIAQPVEFTEEDARRAFSAAQRIVAAVRAHLP
jgi:HEPN domain-containing protein/predicted nucleotidyltransferase